MNPILELQWGMQSRKKYLPKIHAMTMNITADTQAVANTYPTVCIPVLILSQMTFICCSFK